VGQKGLGWSDHRHDCGPDGDTPFMRHFYSDAEREAGYARWARRN